MTTRPANRYRLILTALAVVLYQSSASAGLVGVSPVRVSLDSATRTAVVEISNLGDAPMGIQVDAVSWKQDADGQNVYEPTDDLLAFPPIFTVAPGETQLVRIGQTDEPSAAREQAYRVYFTELPLSETGSADGIGLTMRLRLGVPVFALPIAPSQPELRIVDMATDDDELRVSIYNSGNSHVLLSDLFAEEPDESASSNHRRYLLAGAVQEFSLPIPQGSVVSTIRAVTEQLGTVEFDLETGLEVSTADAELASR